MKTQHEVLMEDPEFRRLLAIEALVAEASETIARLLTEQKLSKADLGRRLNKSRAWVTQLLSGRANMTVRTLAEVMHALGAEVKLNTQPSSSKEVGKPDDTEWNSVFRIDHYPYDSPLGAENLFRLPKVIEDNRAAKVKPLPLSEYAA